MSVLKHNKNKYKKNLTDKCIKISHIIQLGWFNACLKKLKTNNNKGNMNKIKKKKNGCLLHAPVFLLYKHKIKTPQTITVKHTVPNKFCMGIYLCLLLALSIL